MERVLSVVLPAHNEEMNIGPMLAGYRIVEVPVAWIERTAAMGISKFRVFRHGWGYFKVIAHAWRLARQSSS